MAIQAYVVQTPCTVRGEFVRQGTLVSLDLANTALVAEYGGSGNLQPLAASQAGDAADADHAELAD